MMTDGRDKKSYVSGFYVKKGWMEYLGIANFTYHYKEG